MGASLKQFARSLGLGKLKLYGWHRPVGLIRQSIAEGGPIEQWRTEQGRRAMVEAARNLPPLTPPAEDFGARVHFLSGHKFWYQTVFCFVSLQIHSSFRITPVIFDDGTLDAGVRSLISRVIPWAQYVGLEEIESRLDTYLPSDRFPILRARRLVYPHLRKLTDLHAGQSDWALVLDSDMLFFQRPGELLEWFRKPSALYMQDIGNAYGYSIGLMNELAGQTILNKVNVGLYALDRSRIEWNRIESACSTQIEREKPNYLQEQALTAIALTWQNGRALDALNYRLLPDVDEGSQPTAILHHYVAHTKRSYFTSGWRRLHRVIIESSMTLETPDL